MDFISFDFFFFVTLIKIDVAFFLKKISVSFEYIELFCK